MAKSVYEIVIDTQYKGKGAKEADRDFDKLSTRTEKANKSLSSFAAKAAIAGGVLVGAGLAAKQAYEFIGEGAVLSAAAGRFDNLAVSINTTGDALLGKMQVATKGMISDAQLVASGADIMSLGLAKTEQGVVRMATAVGALDLDMQVLALTLANDSTMRLDNLGLSLEAVTKRKKELIASGFIGDAFDEAVLIELEQKMLLLGDASETTAGKMKILEANVANVSDSAKTLVAESGLVQETISRWASLASGLTSVLQAKKEAQDDLNAAVAAGIITDEEAIVIFHKAKEGMEGGEEALAAVRGELSKATSATEGYVWITNQYAMASDLATQAERRRVDELGNTVEATRGYIQENVILDEKIRQQSSLLDAEGVALAAVEAGQRAAALATADHATRTAELLEQAMQAPSIMETYAASLNQSGEAAQTAAGRQDVYRQNVENLGNNVDVAASRVENLTMKLLGIPPSVSSTVKVNTGAAESAISRLEARLRGIGGAADVGTPGPNSPSDPGFGGPANAPGFAHGGQFTVPQGFANDSFPMMVSSKERVTVETPQQQRAGTFNTGNGGGINITVTNSQIDQIPAMIRRAMAAEGRSADNRNRVR